jgi:hypothetical protein
MAAALITRRQFVASAATAAFAPVMLSGLPACSSGAGNLSYEETIQRTWRHTNGMIGEGAAMMRELVRYATLAPSSHNTQCWKFRIEDRAISILPDLARRCPAVDPDDHHLFVSLGCAAENLAQAALANGLMSAARFDTGRGVLRVAFEPTKATASPLFDAIPKRQCTRGEYDAKQLSSEELKLLEQAGAGSGVRVLLFTEKNAMEKILEYVVAGNTAQVNDPAFVRELKEWIRFSDDDAVRAGDGLFTRSSGNPTGPRWFGGTLFNLFFTAKSENEKYAKQVRSSAGIAVFVSDASDKAHWVETGRCYERFALQAAALGVRNAFLNQPVEVSTLRPQFANYLGIGARRPDLVVRFGRGAEMPRSLRRPVDAVLVS